MAERFLFAASECGLDTAVKPLLETGQHSTKRYEGKNDLSNIEILFIFTSSNDGKSPIYIAPRENFEDNLETLIANGAKLGQCLGGTG
jgi:hypothetical protein